MLPYANYSQGKHHSTLSVASNDKILYNTAKTAVDGTPSQTPVFSTALLINAQVTNISSFMKQWLLCL